MKTEDTCPGTLDFKAVRQKTGVFKGIDEEILIIGMTNCGGCPGTRAVARAAGMVKRGADTIALCSCITRGKPRGFPCPHAAEMKAAIAKKLGPSITLLEYSH